MTRFLVCTLLFALGLTGCSFFGPPVQDLQKVTSSKVENPFFNLPAENLKDYQKGVWILLAESKTKNWFYDPYSIHEDEEGIVSFNTFVTERSHQDQLHPFNTTSIGPYLQKIDCFSNYQWSEIYYAEHMPRQETYVSPLKPTQEWGWIKIKPKTSMAYIRARVCGRKFIDDQNVNYFLYQQGRMPYIKEAVEPLKTPVAKDSAEAWVAQFRIEKVNSPSPSSQIEVPNKPTESTPIFYDVVNNQINILDAKKDVRQMKLITYNMDKDFSKREDLVFQANCQSKTYGLAAVGKPIKMEELGESKSDLANIAFNRACGDHGAYMKLGLKK